MDTDRIEIQTPEGFNLEMTLAGVGSRSAAAIIDTIIIVAVWILVYLPFLNEDPPLPVRILLLAVPIVLFFGYHLLFETRGRRQSPGKRVLRLRVVKADGGPAGATASLIRNLIRLIDFLPALYLIGIVTIFSTTQNQRLGDLAAGTIVVLEPRPEEKLPLLSPVFDETMNGWDVSAVTDEDVAMMRQFLSRRETLDPGARRRIGYGIASAIEAKISFPSQVMTSERTIEIVLAIKERRG